jgi:hypothetical protein
MMVFQPPIKVPFMQDDFVVDKSLDAILESLPIGSVQRAIGNNLYGINFRQTGNVVPRAKDQYGFTFFTRPQLNLSTLNITNYRGFYSLLTQNKASYQRFTRAILDPRLGATAPGNTSPGIVCPFVDRTNPFISVLTNNVVSLSGWPDLTVPIHTSDAGQYGQEHSMVDGVTNHFEAFDLDVTFKNTRGNPLIYMFYIWIKYQTLVFEGILNPYLDMITENEIDYNTRVYRLVMDTQKRYVTQIACTGASFPLNVPTGNLFDYNSDTPYNTKNSEINIRFRCMGFLAFEDIIKMYFNQTVAIFNADIYNLLQADMAAKSNTDAVTREDPSYVYSSPGGAYVKIPYIISTAADLGGIDNQVLSVNHKAVPYINLYTNELEWWVKRAALLPDAMADINYLANTL